MLAFFVSSHVVGNCVIERNSVVFTIGSEYDTVLLSDFKVNVAALRLILGTNRHDCQWDEHNHPATPGVTGCPPCFVSAIVLAELGYPGQDE